MATDPFNDPAIGAQIQADVARLQSKWLDWNADAADGTLDEKIVETLVATLNAHARGYIRAVDSSSLISEYVNRLRQVGSLLIRNQRERGFLSDPYNEDRLRQIAESSGKLIQLKFSGSPEAYARALESEIERTRDELRTEAERDLHRRNAMLFRIETLFEARYRSWEAKSIKQAQRGGPSNRKREDTHRGMSSTSQAATANAQDHEFRRINDDEPERCVPVAYSFQLLMTQERNAFACHQNGEALGSPGRANLIRTPHIMPIAWH